MRYLAPLPAILLALLTASCTERTESREYLYRNYGDSWTKYVPPHDSLEQFHLSPDGRHVCYLMKREGRWCVGINGRHSKDFQGLYPSQPSGEPKVVLSPDGQHAGLVFQREASWRPAGQPGKPGGEKPVTQWFVEIDRRILGGFDGEFAPKLQFSPDGRAFGLAYRQRGQYYVQIVDTTFGPYYRSDFTITPEGEVVIAYIEGSYLHVQRVGRVGDTGK